MITKDELMQAGLDAGTITGLIMRRTAAEWTAIAKAATDMSPAARQRPG